MAAANHLARYCPHGPSRKQREFLALQCDEALYGGAAGGGKSDALLMAALQGVHVPAYSAILFRRTFADLNLPEAIMDRSHLWFGGTDAHWEGHDKRWVFPSGARIGFGYLDGPRDHLRYQSAAFQFVGFDELSQFRERQYLYLFSRLRRTEQRIPMRQRGATNPGGEGHKWIQKRWAIPATGATEVIEHAGRVFVPALMRDNPGLDHEEYTRALAKLDRVTRDQLELGKWVLDTSGLVYRYDASQHKTWALPALPHGEHWNHYMAVDFGVVDACAWAVVAASRCEPTVYIVHVETSRGMTPTEVARRTNELIEQWDPDGIVGDAGGLGKGYIEEMRRQWAIPIVPADKADKVGHIKLLNGALEHSDLMVVGDCARPWEEEAEALLWGNEAQTKEHDGLDNHACDAVLYAWRRANRYVVAARDTDSQERAAAAQGMDYLERQAVNRANREISRIAWRTGRAH